MLEKNCFDAKVNTIAAGLKLSVKPKDPDDISYRDNKAVLIGTGGEEIWIRNGGYECSDRMKVTGSLPRSPNGGYAWYGDKYKFSSITMAEIKPGAKMAVEIEKRFMPDYLAAVANAKIYNEAADKVAALKVKILKEVKGADPSEHEIGNNTIIDYIPTGTLDEYGDKKSKRFEAKVDSDGEVTVEIGYVPVELAVKIKNEIKAFYGGKAA